MLYENKAVGERVYTFWRGRRAGYGIALWDLLFPAIFYQRQCSLYDGICNQFYCQLLSDFLFYVRNHSVMEKVGWYGRGASG